MAGRALFGFRMQRVKIVGMLLFLAAFRLAWIAYAFWVRQPVVLDDGCRISPPAQTLLRTVDPDGDTWFVFSTRQYVSNVLNIEPKTAPELEQDLTKQKGWLAEGKQPKIGHVRFEEIETQSGSRPAMIWENSPLVDDPPAEQPLSAQIFLLGEGLDVQFRGNADALEEVVNVVSKIAEPGNVERKNNEE